MNTDEAFQKAKKRLCNIVEAFKSGDDRGFNLIGFGADYFIDSVLQELKDDLNLGEK